MLYNSIVNFAFTLIFGILLFIAFTLLRRKMDVFFLITFAIGAAINANIFNAYIYPITIDGVNLVFGLNQFLYPLFVLTIMIRAFDYSLKDAKSMLVSALVAIVLSAFIQFFAEISYYHSFDERPFIQVLLTLLLYLVSTLATLIGFIIVFKLYPILEKKKVNNYLILVIAIAITNIINPFIYTGFALIFKDYSPLSEALFDNYLGYILGSIIIRVFATGLALLSYFINNTIWKSENLIQVQKETK